MNSIKESRIYLLLFSIRPTVQREAIMDYLLKNRCHPTVDDIYMELRKTIPTLSRMTIYNSLDFFIRQGAVQSFQVSNESVRYDIETDAHAHFVCKTCGLIHNVESHNSSLFAFPKKTKFAISSVDVLYIGVCQSCLLKSQFNSYFH